MKLLIPLLIVFAVSCSSGQASQQTNEAQALASSVAQVSATGRVTDAANIISAEQEVAFSHRLASFEQATSHQMAIVTVRSLGGQDIAAFTQALANSWGVGRKDYNDGVVVLIAPNERRVRIAVGYGLEEALPDAVCQTILDQHMRPRFRKGDFEGGIEAGVSALINELS